MFDERPIGVFDSGVGGLTVLDAIRTRLPAEPLLYLGDTARVPYGNKAPETVLRYAVGATRFLVERGVKAVVIACNTASAYGLTRVQDLFDVPVIGVIDPVARVATETTSSGEIGVIGTRGTVSSEAYVRSIHAQNPSLRVHQSACPLFVPLAEEGWSEDPVTLEVARRYLGHIAQSKVDTLILGCTHYPILRPGIAAVLGELTDRPITLLDSAVTTAQALTQVLERQGLRASGQRNKVRFAVTDDPLRFAHVGTYFLASPIEDVEHVDLPGATGLNP